MPSDWDGGTVTATFYWTNTGTTANTCKWECQGRSYGDAETLNQTLATGVQSVTDTYTTTARQVMISAATAAITLNGTPAASELVVFQISRDPANDTLTTDAQLLGVMIGYTRT